MGKTIKVRVGYTDDANFPEEVTSTATDPVAPLTVVPPDWSLIPAGLGRGDRFRLLFIYSASRTAEPTDIGDYNTWIQDQVAAGQADIQDYGSTFRVAGSTNDVDARENTGTTYTSSDKGVPIYWLGGAKVADDYPDFFDGDWDDETSRLTESGAHQSIKWVWTGSTHDGTESISSRGSHAVGNAGGRWVKVGKLGNSGVGDGPLYFWRK